MFIAPVVMRGSAVPVAMCGQIPLDHEQARMTTETMGTGSIVRAGSKLRNARRVPSAAKPKWNC
jgi:hypothetical protein